MSLHLTPTDLGDAAHQAAFLALLQHYAADPMGGGAGLAPAVQAALVPELQKVPHFHGALAWREGEAVGLINCFAGFSTFAAKPLLNIHDVVVHSDHRGAGIGQALLAWAAERALALGCCKLTLEVLANTHKALAAYQRAGFAPYVLDPAAGQALFLEKRL
ncbi:MAG TPA: GNAT family N-acetyltransferase [Azospira sp.]|nr:GNAT family N-acetyltransferase [Azospira sp.]